MPFRIRPDAEFTKAFREAATGELRQAIATLEQRPNGTHEAIHAFRKNLKKLRSLYRLVAVEARDFQRHENARLRDAAKSLSAIRDAAALIGTVQYLQGTARNADERDALGRIVTILEVRRDWMADADTGIEKRLLETAARLEDAVAALADVSFPDSPAKAAKLLAKGWKRSASKAQRALAACRGEASADAFHELRKRTQDYRANHGLLSPIWPGAMKAKRAAAKELVDLLGHVHDLAVLCELVEAEPQLFTRNDDLTHLLDAIIYRQQEDRRDALVKAEIVFADDPAADAERIRLLWLACAK